MVQVIPLADQLDNHIKILKQEIEYLKIKVEYLEEQFMSLSSDSNKE
jgi:hypothetical protein